jgi:hypothetical protein
MYIMLPKVPQINNTNNKSSQIVESFAPLVVSSTQFLMKGMQAKHPGAFFHLESITLTI